MATTHEVVQTDRFSVEIALAGYQSIKSYPIPNNSVLRLELTLVARQTDGSNRAMFKRTGLFYRQGGSVQIEKVPHTDQTIKSDKVLDTEFILGPSEVTIQVRNALASATRWVGAVGVIQAS